MLNRFPRMAQINNHLAMRQMETSSLSEIEFGGSTPAEFFTYSLLLPRQILIYQQI